MKGLSFKEANRQALRLLRQFDLEEEKSYLVNKLTFGGKRRLCLARALIGHSEVPLEKRLVISI